MGSINAYDIKKIKQVYNLECFIETGTWKGTGVEGIINVDFKQIFSVDISPKHLYENMNKFMNDSRVQLFIGESVNKLPDMLNKVIPTYNILFWLDAHLPDLDGKEKLLSKNIIEPLETEIRTIKKYRDISKDVFIIDDLRLYEYVNEPGFINYRDKDYDGSINFVFELLNDTHYIQKDFRNQGYVACYPKK